MNGKDPGPGKSFTRPRAIREAIEWRIAEAVPAGVSAMPD